MKTSFLSKSCVISGNVTLGNNVSVWHNAVIRADVDKIIIGDNTNIQDCAVIHPNQTKPVIIGNNVTVGHGAIIHGCKIEDDCLIGMGSIILDGAIIEKNCIVGAGALISGGKIIKSGSIVVGNPARFLRNVSENDIEYIKNSAGEYVDLAIKAKKDGIIL